MGFTFKFGASRSKSNSKLTLPDINSLSESERPKAIEEMVALINNQKIVFDFRKVDPDAQGQEILEAVAKAVCSLPEYTILVEGHSNLAKSEHKLTPEDQSRIKKLCEDRADACTRVLKTAGVQNEINCAAQGALKGETKGCVKLVLFKSEKGSTPLKAEDTQPKQLDTKASETEADLPQTEEADKIVAAIDTLTPDTNVEDSSVTSVSEVLKDQSSSEEKYPNTRYPSEPECTPEGSLKIDSVAVDPKDVDCKVVETTAAEEVDPVKKLIADEKLSVKEDKGIALTVQPKDFSRNAESKPPVTASAENKAWGNTNLPWFIACCAQNSKPKVEACPLGEGTPIKQLQCLQ